MFVFVLIQEDGLQSTNNIYICFSGRGDCHRWLSLPVPPALQECDAVANLSDDGNQLQVWPAPIRGFAFSFPNMPLMYLLFKDGSGRGAALVAAVLKGKGEWPLLHKFSSSNSNCLVDHLNQLWLDLSTETQYLRSFQALPTVSTESSKHQIKNFKRERFLIVHLATRKLGLTIS